MASDHFEKELVWRYWNDCLGGGRHGRITRRSMRPVEIAWKDGLAGLGITVLRRDQLKVAWHAVAVVTLSAGRRCHSSEPWYDRTSCHCCCCYCSRRSSASR